MERVRGEGDVQRKNHAKKILGRKIFSLGLEMELQSNAKREEIGMRFQPSTSGAKAHGSFRRLRTA
jgi:hypothetical protein